MCVSNELNFDINYTNLVKNESPVCPWKINGWKECRKSEVSSWLA